MKCDVVSLTTLDDVLRFVPQGVLHKTPGAVTPEALSEYLRCFCCTSTIHAGREDFRASADIDLEMDEADDRAGNKIVAPVHVLWGAVDSGIPSCPISRMAVVFESALANSSQSSH